MLLIFHPLATHAPTTNYSNKQIKQKYLKNGSNSKFKCPICFCVTELLHVFHVVIAHKGLSLPATRNFDWQRASSKSPKQNQNLKLQLLFRIDHAALSDVRSETKLICALYKL